MIREGQLKILVSEFDDLVFYINNPIEHIQSSWKIGQYYELKMIEFIKLNYKGGTFIDVGSCIGNHTLAFSKIADKVISFEAFDKNHFQQAFSILLNDIKNVDLYNIGISDKNELLNFSTPLNGNVGGGKFNEEGSIKMVTTTLDSFDIKNVKLVKIDVEGFEMRALKGAIKTLKTNIPDLFIECSTSKELDNVLSYLRTNVHTDYRTYKTIFNHTPTYLFTIKQDEEYKEVKK